MKDGDTVFTSFIFVEFNCLPISDIVQLEVSNYSFIIKHFKKRF